MTVYLWHRVPFKTYCHSCELSETHAACTPGLLRYVLRGQPPLRARMDGLIID